MPRSPFLVKGRRGREEKKRKDSSPDVSPLFCLVIRASRQFDVMIILSGLIYFSLIRKGINGAPLLAICITQRKPPPLLVATGRCLNDRERERNEFIQNTLIVSNEEIIEKGINGDKGIEVVMYCCYYRYCNRFIPNKYGFRSEMVGKQISFHFSSPPQDCVPTNS